MKLMLILSLLFSFNSFCLANVMFDKNDMNQFFIAAKEQGEMSEEAFNKEQQELNKMSDAEFKELFQKGINKMSEEELEFFKYKASELIKNNPKLLEKINQLKNQNKMSDEELKKKLNKMSEEEFEYFKYKNSEHIKNNPKFLEKINQLRSSKY